MNKRIFIVMSFLMLLFVGCDKEIELEKDTIVKIEIVETTIPEFIYAKDFEISSIKIKVTFSDNSIETISLSKDMLDQTDLEKFSKPGEHVIEVKYKEFSDTFSVLVKPKNPTSLTIKGNASAYEGEQKTLSVEVLPTDANKDVIWTSLNTNIATVNQQGVVTGLKGGKTTIKVESKSNLTVKAEIIFIVHFDLVGPNIPNLLGYEIVIMTMPQLKGEHDPFMETYLFKDKEAKQKAWRDAEDIYNTTMKVEQFPDDIPSYGTERINWFLEKATMYTSVADIIVSYSDWTNKLANGYAIIDVSSYYEQYGKNSMSQAVKEAATYKDKLYQLPSNNLGTIQANRGLVYNVELLNHYGLENPAKLFNDGLWTWTKFDDYVTKAALLLNSNESVLSGKPADLYYGLANAAGVKIIDSTIKEANFTHPYVMNAVKIIQDLYTKPKVWGDNAYEVYNQSFNDGRSIFQVSEYSVIKRNGGFPANLWGNDTKFGYVPFPYPDNLSKEETRNTYEVGKPIYQMLAGKVYKAGVTSEHIYRVFTHMMNATIMNINTNPDYNSNVFMEDAARFKLDDEESVKAITYFTEDKLIYDPLYRVYLAWIHIGPMMDEVVVQGKDYLEVLDKYGLNDLYLYKLDEIHG